MKCRPKKGPRADLLSIAATQERRSGEAESRVRFSRFEV